MPMNLSGEHRIPAPVQEVWDALNDPAMLQTCIPGCTSLEKISGTEFAATVALKLGPVAATFRGGVALSDLVPLRGYTLTGHGQGGPAGFAKMTAHVALSESGGVTLLTYVASAEVGGKIASVGSRLVQGVAKKNADDFFSTFAGRFAGGDRVRSPDTDPVAAGAGNSARASNAEVPSSRAIAALGYNVPVWMLAAACCASIALGYLLGHFA